MKKLLFVISAVILTLTACNPQPKTTDNDFTMPAVDDIAMYQVNPRVFAPDHSLNAVAARIDSIRALGVNVMWVMPIYPIGIEKGKNSPYCISDYKAIAPEFGTIDDFKNLVRVCHEHQMGIILDWVANHTAWDHPWLKAHPDWYTHDAETDTIIHPRPWDWYDVADLNYDNRDMRLAMIDAMKFLGYRGGHRRFPLRRGRRRACRPAERSYRHAARCCRSSPYRDAGRGQAL